MFYARCGPKLEDTYAVRDIDEVGHGAQVIDLEGILSRPQVWLGMVTARQCML